MGRPKILDRVEDHGFVVFDSDTDHDLNIIGLRNPNRAANSFDDLLFDKSVILLFIGIL